MKGFFLGWIKFVETTVETHFFLAAPCISLYLISFHFYLFPLFSMYKIKDFSHLNCYISVLLKEKDKEVTDIANNISALAEKKTAAC